MTTRDDDEEEGFSSISCETWWETHHNRAPFLQVRHNFPSHFDGSLAVALQPMTSGTVPYQLSSFRSPSSPCFVQQRAEHIQGRSHLIHPPTLPGMSRRGISAPRRADDQAAGSQPSRVAAPSHTPHSEVGATHCSTPCCPPASCCNTLLVTQVKLVNSSHEFMMDPASKVGYLAICDMWGHIGTGTGHADRKPRSANLPNPTTLSAPLPHRWRWAHPMHGSSLACCRLPLMTYPVVTR